ncbi:hypothetical protein FRC16_006507 [Serendipita sp. 398]|nr:hypothetical protein FRC16_006507 [Serendipita sp. 398]
MDRFKKHKLFRSRLSTAVIVPTTSNLVLATAEIVLPTQIVTDEIPDPHPVDPLGLSLAFSIAGFKTLQEVAEVIPVAGGPLKAICSILICILHVVKSCKKNREGWEKLSDIIKEKNKCILALLELYSRAPMEYPSAESQAREYQHIAVDIKKETQRKTEASQELETYWSRMQSTGREAVLAKINAHKIISYQEQLQRVAFSVIEMTMIHQALAMTQGFNDIKAMMTEQTRMILADKSSSRAPSHNTPGKEHDIELLKPILSTEQVDMSMVAYIGRCNDMQAHVAVKTRGVSATGLVSIIQDIGPSEPARKRPSLVVGRFSTMDVRPWHEPRHQTSKHVAFVRDYTSPPHLFVGLSHFDVDCSTNIRVMANASDVTTDGFRLRVDSWGDTILYASRVGWIEMTPNEQYGRFSTADAPRSPVGEPRTKTSRRITFSRPFDQPPRVVVTLSALDMEAGRDCRVVVRATDIESDGFVIHIDTWDDSVLHMAKADWFAYPVDRKDIVTGTLTGLDSSGKKRNHIGTIDFDGELSKIPNVFVGINMLDVGCEASLRVSAFVDSVSTTGMTWRIETWGDTLLYGAGISYYDDGRDKNSNNDDDGGNDDDDDDDRVLLAFL